MNKIYFLFLMTLLPLQASAETAEINGIYYDLDPEAKTATVISKSNGKYEGDIVIPKTVTFKNVICKVTSIRYEAFYYCQNLTSVTIPNGINSIGNNAFNSCSTLTSITIPNSVASIGENAFYGTPWYNNKPDGIVYAGKVLYSYKGTMPEGTKISIKDGTRGIAGRAFENRYNLTSVTIPNSITSIGSSAFYNCIGLTSITIPNNVTSINYQTFSGCI